MRKKPVIAKSRKYIIYWNCSLSNSRQIDFAYSDLSDRNKFPQRKREEKAVEKKTETVEQQECV